MTGQQRPLALVTGASSGIGASFARRIAASGYDVALAARSADRLRALSESLGADHEAHAPVYPVDLGASDGPARLQDAVGADGRAVDVLINNAGFGLAGDFTDLDHDRQLAMTDLNIRALTDLARRFLPDMLARKRGGIINVASTAAFQPGPGMAVYFATKAYVLSLSEALWEETRPAGVTVTALCPGATATEFFAQTGDFEFSRTAKKMTPDDVAAQGWAAFRAGKRVCVPGAVNKATAAAAGVMPKRVVLAAARKILRTT